MLWYPLSSRALNGFTTLSHFQTFTISGFVLIPIHGSIHALQILRITRVLCSTLKGGVPQIWGGGSAGELLAHRRADRLPSSSAAHTWKRLEGRAPVGWRRVSDSPRVAHLPSLPAAAGPSNYSTLQQPNCCPMLPQLQFKRHLIMRFSFIHTVFRGPWQHCRPLCIVGYHSLALGGTALLLTMDFIQ